MTRALVVALVSPTEVDPEQLGLPTVGRLTELGRYGTVAGTPRAAAEPGWSALAGPHFSKLSELREPDTDPAASFLCCAPGKAPSLTQEQPRALVRRLEAICSGCVERDPESTHWTQARSALALRAYDLLMVVDALAPGDSAELQLEQDGRLGSLLEVLDESASLLVLILPAQAGIGPERAGFFVHYDPATPPGGAVPAPVSLDAAVRWLFPQETGGLEVQAASLDESEMTDAQEAILRERLSGLGYLG